MKYFFDTEFMEDGSIIDLISIGIVSEDGREFYAESADADFSKANDWVKANVLPHLTGESWPKWKIARKVAIMCGDGAPEFWTWYGAYDWVALCQLFGRMIDLPRGFPMFACDLKQLQRDLDVRDDQLPNGGRTSHNALEDARWTRDAHSFLMSVRA